MKRNLFWYGAVALFICACLAGARAQIISDTGLIANLSGFGCTASANLQGRMDGSQNKTAVDTMICGMVSDGNYSNLDGLYMFATNSQANAQLNWAQNAFNLTKNGSCTFVANGGYTGDGTGAGSGTCFFNTGFNPSTAGGHYTLNASSLGFCITSAFVNSGQRPIAATDTTNFLIMNQNTSAQITVWANVLSTNSYTIGVTSSVGSYLADRNSSTNNTLYKNGTSQGSQSKTSSALPNANIYIMAENNNGTAANFSGATLAWALFGGNFTSSTQATLYSRLHNYLVAVGSSC